MKNIIFIVLSVFLVFSGFSAFADEDYMTESGEIREVSDGEIMTDSGEIEDVGSNGSYMTDSGEMGEVTGISEEAPESMNSPESPDYDD